MANHYRRAKLAADAFRAFTSKFQSKPDPISRFISTNSSSSAPKPATFSRFSPPNSISHIPVPQNRLHPVFNLARKRCYHADSKDALLRSTVASALWNIAVAFGVLVLSVVTGGVLLTLKFWEDSVPYTVPYTKRKPFLAVSTNKEKELGEREFERIKDGFEWEILPANHQESVRVRQISNKIINALKRGLLHEQGCTDLGYASEGRGSETVIEKDSGAKNAASHLLDLNWEVLVVDQPTINAISFFNGKIVVSTGLLNHLKTDAEIATIIGHEVGHTVARHLTKILWASLISSYLYMIFRRPYLFDEMPDEFNPLTNLCSRLPFSWRMEMEADHIGLLLTASAGYDPRVAPTVYEKLSQVTGGDSALKDYISTHPSGKKRAEMLVRAHIMEEALTIYRDVIAGR